MRPTALTPCIPRTRARNVVVEYTLMAAAYACNALGIAYLEQADFAKAIPAFRDARLAGRVTGPIRCTAWRWRTSKTDDNKSGPSCCLC